MGVSKKDRKFLLMGAFVILTLAFYCVAGTPPSLPDDATATATATTTGKR